MGSLSDCIKLQMVDNVTPLCQSETGMERVSDVSSRALGVLDLPRSWVTKPDGEGFMAGAKKMDHAKSEALAGVYAFSRCRRNQILVLLLRRN